MLLDAEKPFNISMWLKMVGFTPNLWPFGKNRENDFSDPWVNWGVPYVQTKLFRTELWDHQKSTAGWLDRSTAPHCLLSFPDMPWRVSRASKSRNLRFSVVFPVVFPMAFMLFVAESSQLLLYVLA